MSDASTCVDQVRLTAGAGGGSLLSPTGAHPFYQLRMLLATGRFGTQSGRAALNLDVDQPS